MLLAGFVFVYWPAWRNMVADWYASEEYSHGFLILPLAVYIGFRKHERLSTIPLTNSLWGLALVVFALLFFVLAQSAEIKTLSSLSIVLFMWGAIFYVFGYGWLRELSFPLFILFFMIPIPSQIYAQATIPLQLIVTKTSVAAAGIFDIPILREGNVIHLPDRSLQVVQACSGLRSMISLVTLSAVMGYLTLKSNLLRGVLFIGGVPVAILTNIIRVFFMILAFHYLKLDLAKGTAHTFFGIGIFVFAILMLLGLKGILGRWDVHPSNE